MTPKITIISFLLSPFTTTAFIPKYDSRTIQWSRRQQRLPPCKGFIIREFQSVTTHLSSDHDILTLSSSSSSSSSSFSMIRSKSDTRYSARDWFAIIRSLPRSSILREIKGPVAAVAIWSFILSVIHCVLKRRYGEPIANLMCISSTPHSFLVSSLGLLLVFRTNSAYQRFAEGRKIWERLLSTSRNLSRMSHIYLSDLGQPRFNRMQRLLASFPYLLRYHVQPQQTQQSIQNLHITTPHILPPIVKRLLPPQPLRDCIASSNRPLWICDRLSAEISTIPHDNPYFTSRERLAFISHVNALSNAIGECERIHQTAVPLNYARHSLRSLAVWLFGLPFALIGSLGLATGPVAAVMSWLLLGVYQIGYTIEDPFQGSLRLSILCDAVYGDVVGGGTGRDTAFYLGEEEKEEDWGLIMVENEDKEEEKEDTRVALIGAG